MLIALGGVSCPCLFLCVAETKLDSSSVKSGAAAAPARLVISAVTARARFERAVTRYRPGASRACSGRRDRERDVGSAHHDQRGHLRMDVAEHTVPAAVVNVRERDAPARYRPRSKGVAPTARTRCGRSDRRSGTLPSIRREWRSRCGWNVLFFCRSVNRPGLRGAATSIGSA